jgi:hypothetical protein
MQSLIQRALNGPSHPPIKTGFSAKDAFDLARFHLERGRQEDYLVWTMIAEFLEAVEKQALRPLN